MKARIVLDAKEIPDVGLAVSVEVDISECGEASRSALVCAFCTALDLSPAELFTIAVTSMTASEEDAPKTFSNQADMDAYLQTAKEVLQ